MFVTPSHASLTAVAIATGFGAASVTHAATLHVPSEYPTIQVGINFSTDGDEIVVAPGTYFESITFGGRDVVVRSSDGAGVTTIDAFGQAAPAVLFTGFETADAVLDGFTITRGDHSQGGGIRIVSSDPIIRHCVITENTATQGSGVFSAFANPTLEDCTISDNLGNGALWISDGNGLVTRCDIVDNTGLAGGFHGARTSTQFIDCRFLDNTATGGGGGAVYTSFSPGPSFVRTEFSGNSTTGADESGGAVFIYATPSTFSDCVFRDNVATGNGGALAVWSGASVTATGCTFVGNSSSGGGGGGAVYTRGDSVATIRNSIAWDNAPNQFNSATTSTYCDVQGGFSGTGNVNVDPLFVDAEGGDLGLQPESAVIDAGNTSLVTGPYPIDFDGGRRAVNDPDVIDTGIALLNLAVDMGAIERQVDGAPVSCPSDLDGNGVTDFGDLLQILVEWGPCP